MYIVVLGFIISAGYSVFCIISLITDLLKRQQIHHGQVDVLNDIEANKNIYHEEHLSGMSNPILFDYIKDKHFK